MFFFFHFGAAAGVVIIVVIVGVVVVVSERLFSPDYTLRIRRNGEKQAETPKMGMLGNKSIITCEDELTPGCDEYGKIIWPKPNTQYWTDR